MAVFALLVALIAVCGIAYLYYALVMLNPAAAMTERLTGLQAAQSQLGADLRHLAGEQQTALEAFRAEQEERQRAFESALAESLGETTAPDRPSQRAWRLAEVEFLLRAANHRARFERDARLALDLLRSADSMLGELDGFVASEVRVLIASEMLSLEQAEVADASAIYLRLDAIKRRVADLTPALPQYVASAPADTAVPTIEKATSPNNDAGFFPTLAEELGRLIRFRRIDTALERPPIPAESDALELNLRLMLEQAQLAALRRDQATYASSLDAALAWIPAMLDGQDARVQETIGALEALRRLDLETPLPDISGSLNELLKARREPM